MANKRFLLAILAVALVFGMTVVGCNDAQIVAFERADSVSNVRVIVSMSKDKFDNPTSSVDVWWDAAKNAVSYDVYVQDFSDNGVKMDIKHLSSVPPLGTSFCFNSSPNLYYVNNGPEFVRFGVTATDFDTNHAVSNIVWSDWIDISKTGSTGGGGEDNKEPEYSTRIGDIHF
jgi:hypothetical protein